MTNTKAVNIMSYEYKDYFKRLHINESGKVGTDLNDSFNARDELNEVYRKAKAWDRTQELLEECTHQTPGDDYEVDWHEFEMKIDDIINKYEGGESDDN